MKNLNLLKSCCSIYFLFLLLLFISCSDSGEDADPCASGPTLEINNITASVAGKNNGTIEVAASGGSNMLQYSIDGTNFQSAKLFTDLAPGDYTLTVKDANNCTSTASATVEEIPEVFYANQIRPIIDTNCQISNCHGSNGSIPTFATYDNVKNNAQGIKFRTSAKTMPPSGALPDSDIQLIANWVDQGAPNN
jgi:hypothetical protein